MNSIIADQNFNYNNIIPKPDEGTNFLSGPLIQINKVYKNYTITSTSNGTRYQTLSSSYTNNIYVYHLYGTIEKDLTSDIICYRIRESLSSNDPSALFSANPYSSIDIIDYVWMNSRNYANWNGTHLDFLCYDKNWNAFIPDEGITVSMTLETYAL